MNDRNTFERNTPTAKELRSRRGFSQRMADLRASGPENSDSFPSAEDMIREDRNR